MSLESRQKLLARFLDDASFEARVREVPELIAEAMRVQLAFVLKLVRMDPRRIQAFRASQQVKARRRHDESSSA